MIFRHAFVHLFMKNLSLLLVIFLLVSCKSRKEEQPSAPGPLNNPAADAPSPAMEKLGSNKFEILSTHHNTTMKNYHLLVVDPKIDSASLQEFVNKFREKYCELQCNIMLYDDRAVAPYLLKYPLPDSDYVRLADHYIAASAFEPTAIKLYPFKDDRYKRLKANTVK